MADYHSPNPADVIAAARLCDAAAINAMNPSDRLSYELHAGIADKLLQNPSKVIEIARDELQRVREAGRSNVYESLWLAVLAEPPETIVRVLLDDSDRGQDLRSHSVFKRVITQDERWDIIDRLSPTSLSPEQIETRRREWGRYDEKYWRDEELQASIAAGLASGDGPLLEDVSVEEIAARGRLRLAKGRDS